MPVDLHDIAARIDAARVYALAARTPLQFAPKLAEELGRNVWLKREDMQDVFSFKVRGAANRMAALKDHEKARGVCAASAGNHAQGVAKSAAHYGVDALIVAAKCCDQLGLPRSMIRGYTMPGFGTSDHTKSNAWKLMKAIGITAEEIDIRPAATRMLEDMKHPFADGEPVHDVTFENVQANRTHMRLTLL